MSKTILQRLGRYKTIKLDSLSEEEQNMIKHAYICSGCKGDIGDTDYTYNNKTELWTNIYKCSKCRVTYTSIDQ